MRNVYVVTLGNGQYLAEGCGYTTDIAKARYFMTFADAKTKCLGPEYVAKMLIAAGVK